MNKERPKASVLMPVFNALPFLKDSIESILSQSFSDFEFVIVDDGSFDGSSELLKEYAGKDRRIHLFRNEENMGIVFSLNRGLKECSGDYIVRMDPDDIAAKDRIEKQVSALNKDHNISALGSAVSYIDASGSELGVIRRCSLDGANLSQTPLMHCTVAIRRASLLQHNLLYLEKYAPAEDYFFWLQLSRVGKISAVEDVLLKYRITKNSARVTMTKKIVYKTLIAKKDAVFLLKIKPRLQDVCRILLEVILLLLPAKAILFLYFKTTFQKGLKIKL